MGGRSLNHQERLTSQHERSLGGLLSWQYIARAQFQYRTQTIIKSLPHPAVPTASATVLDYSKGSAAVTNQ